MGGLRGGWGCRDTGEAAAETACKSDSAQYRTHSFSSLAQEGVSEARRAHGTLRLGAESCGPLSPGERVERGWTGLPASQPRCTCECECWGGCPGGRGSLRPVSPSKHSDQSEGSPAAWHPLPELPETWCLEVAGNNPRRRGRRPPLPSPLLPSGRSCENPPIWPPSAPGTKQIKSSPSL